MWPSPQEFNEAIQNPGLCFRDEDLRNAHIETSPLGLPRAATGAFASVYKLSKNNQHWAVRCLLSNRPEQKERYAMISEFVLMDELACTVDFHYLDQGIRVGGQWYPIVKMDWVQGLTLDQYLCSNYKNREKIRNLLARFHELALELENAGIAHCDLQHGNIMVTNDGLRLVDYDALFVPALSGKKSLELGHANYQHPDRTEYQFDTTTDNFSVWLIKLCLEALAIDPGLFERYYRGDDCILLKKSDLEKPEESLILQEMLDHESEEIIHNARLILRLLWSSPSLIPELHAPEYELEILPHSPPTRSSIDGDSSQSSKNSESSNNSLLVSNTDIGIYRERQFPSSRIEPRKKYSRRSLISHIAKTGRSIKGKLTNSADAIFRIGNIKLWSGLKLHLAERQINQGNHDKARNYLLEIIKHEQSAKKLSNRFLYIVYTRTGLYFSLDNKYSQAHNYFLLASQLAEYLEIEEEKLLSSARLSFNHYLNGQIDSALNEINKRSDILDDFDNWLALAYSLTNKRSIQSIAKSSHALEFIFTLERSLKRKKSEIGSEKIESDQIKLLQSRIESLQNSAISLYRKMTRSTSPGTDRKILLLLLLQLDESCKSQQIGIQKIKTQTDPNHLIDRQIREIKDICLEIARKDPIHAEAVYKRITEEKKNTIIDDGLGTSAISETASWLEAYHQSKAHKVTLDSWRDFLEIAGMQYDMDINSLSKALQYKFDQFTRILLIEQIQDPAKIMPLLEHFDAETIGEFIYRRIRGIHLNSIKEDSLDSEIESSIDVLESLLENADPRNHPKTYDQIIKICMYAPESYPALICHFYKRKEYASLDNILTMLINDIPRIFACSILADTFHKLSPEELLLYASFALKFPEAEQFWNLSRLSNARIAVDRVLRLAIERGELKKRPSSMSILVSLASPGVSIQELRALTELMFEEKESLSIFQGFDEIQNNLVKRKSLLQVDIVSHHLFRSGELNKLADYMTSLIMIRSKEVVEELLLPMSDLVDIELIMPLLRKRVSGEYFNLLNTYVECSHRGIDFATLVGRNNEMAFFSDTESLKNTIKNILYLLSNDERDRIVLFMKQYIENLLENRIITPVTVNPGKNSTKKTNMPVLNDELDLHALLIDLKELSFQNAR